MYSQTKIAIPIFQAKKEDVVFWRLDIFLDDQGQYKSHSIRKFLGLYPW